MKVFIFCSYSHQNSESGRFQFVRLDLATKQAIWDMVHSNDLKTKLLIIINNLSIRENENDLYQWIHSNFEKLKKVKELRLLGLNNCLTNLFSYTWKIFL